MSSIIIQCPACKTKFSVEQSQLQGVSRPRFHCSRCSHYFELHEARRAEQLDLLDRISEKHSPSFEVQELDTKQSPSLTEPDDSLEQEDLHFGSESPSVTADWPCVKESEPYTADLGKFAQRSPFSGEKFRTLQSNSQTSNTNGRCGSAEVLEWPLSRLGQSSKTTDTPAVRSVRSAMSGNLAFDNDLQDDFVPQLRSGHQTPSFEIEDEGDAYTQPTFAIGREDESPEEENAADPSSTIVPGMYLDDIGDNYEAKRKPEIREKLEPQILPVKSEQTTPTAKKTSPTVVRGAFWGLASLLVLFVFLILAGSVYMLPRDSDFKPLLSSFVTSLGISAISLPPHSLVVAHPEARFSVLDNGVQVVEVLGSVKNLGTLAVNNVQLDIRVFDENNREIGSVLAFMDNGLSRARSISALNVEDLRALQETRSGNLKDGLAPGKEEPFRVVFPRPDPRSRWFGASIYSAKRFE